MPPHDSTAIVSLVLALAVIAAAALLAVRQWMERQARNGDLSAEDARYFARQDARRFLGAALLVLVAIGLALGSRIPTVRANQPTRLVFVAIWSTEFLLLFVLLGLAWRDIRATGQYARRHRRAILDEHRALVAAQRRRRAIDGNGHRETSDLDLPE